MNYASPLLPANFLARRGRRLIISSMAEEASPDQTPAANNYTAIQCSRYFILSPDILCSHQIFFTLTRYFLDNFPTSHLLRCSHHRHHRTGEGRHLISYHRPAHQYIDIDTDILLHKVTAGTRFSIEVNVWGQCGWVWYGANLSAAVTLYSAAATSAIDHPGSNRWGSVDSRQHC